jgi:ParB-like chromosome segregation protein Spo0J
MKIIKKNITDLIKAEYNPRKISKVQEEDLRDSLEKFGLVDPIIININPDRKNIVIGGHQRLKIWEELGNKTIECNQLNLSLDRERELNIRLNKNTGTFDDDLIREHFNYEELTEWGFTPGEIYNEELSEEDEKEYFYDDKWFLNIEFEQEEDIQKWYNKLTKEGLTCKIIQ